MTPREIKADLRKSGLPDAYIKRMGCQPATCEEISEASGVKLERISENGGYSIPYPGVAAHDGSPFRRYRLCEGKPKYLGLLGHDFEIYVPLDFDKNFKANPDCLIIVEGEKKAATLDALGIPALGIPGVQCWFDPGARALQKEASLGLDQSTIPHKIICEAACKAKFTTIIGDSDVEYNVRAASSLATLQRALQKYVDSKAINNMLEPRFDPVYGSRVPTVLMVVMPGPFQLVKKKAKKKVEAAVEATTEENLKPPSEALTDETTLKATGQKVGADDWIHDAIQGHLNHNSRNGYTEDVNAIRANVARHFLLTVRALALFEAQPTDEFLGRLVANFNQNRVAIKNGQTMFYQEQTGSWVEDASNRRLRIPASIAVLFSEALLILQSIANKKMEPFTKCDGTEIPISAKVWYKRFCRKCDQLRSTESRLSSAKGAKNVLDMSKSMLDIPGDRWDTHGHLFSAANKLIDLRTGSAVDPSPSYLITMHSSVHYDPHAECPKWQAFLREVQPEAVVRSYLQAIAGYWAFASSREQKMWFFTGGGGNGKGTFLKLVLAVLGPYGVTAPKSVLVKPYSGPDAHPADTASLRGRRLAKISELDGQYKIDSGTLKNLTGGDAIATRGMRENFSNVQQTWTFVCDTNYYPHISDTCYGMKRRLEVFDWPFKPSQIDKALEDTLMAELPGILNWLLEGAVMYTHGGLNDENIPEAIKKQTAAMWEQIDIVEEWIRHSCKPDTGRTDFTKLYANFSKWLKDNGHGVFSSTNLGIKLREKGFRKQFSDGHTYYHGIRLLTQAEHNWPSSTDQAPFPIEPASREKKSPQSEPSNEKKTKRRII